MKVIAISGHAQNGKDTVANMMKSSLEEHGSKVLITHYADLLKYICKTFFGWNGAKDESGRALLQYVGTDVIRSINPDYWVDFVIGIIRMFNAWDYVIIPDTRFPNEVERLKRVKDLDVQHWRVVRTGFNSGLTEAQKTHASETALDSVDPDLYIYNDGSIKNLGENLEKIMKERLYD